jgi:hypothetical protein
VHLPPTAPLLPRLDFRKAARRPRVLREEKPFHCVRCGTAFATETSLERTLAKLAGHSMFAAPGALEQPKMCQDCRVEAMLEGEAHPLAQGAVPRPRTTADYLRDREEAIKVAGRRPVGSNES